MMDRKVIRHLAVVPTPVEQKKLEDETARLESVANASADKYISDQLNPPEPEKNMSPIPKNVATVLGVISVAALAVAQFVPQQWLLRRTHWVSEQCWHWPLFHLWFDQ